MRRHGVQPYNGILVINKPSQITSHDVVDIIRRRFHMRQVGHAGTLDPLATGVLIILLGAATKLFNKFSAFDKAYTATMTLGLVTDTADINGRVLKQADYAHVTSQHVEQAFSHFLGDIEQIPPMVSAVKHNGKRLYQLARAGLEVKREARKISIYSLRMLGFEPPNVSFSLECSKGTYVRKIAEDVGEVLGCGACISQIHRTKVGPFDIAHAVHPNQASESNIQGINHVRFLRDAL